MFRNASLALVAIFVVTAVTSRPAWSQPVNPDPDRVLATDEGWEILPTSTDDHDNLEWALRNTPSGGVVSLGAGTYKVSRPVVVPDFDGTLKGRGAGVTTIQVTDALNLQEWVDAGADPDAKPDPFPRVQIGAAATRTPPAVLMFYKTPPQPGEDPDDRANAIALRNFRYRGSSYADPWALGNETVFAAIFNSFDWNDPTQELPLTRQDVIASGLFIDGYSDEEAGMEIEEFQPFGNGCSCLTVVGGLVLTGDYDLTGDDDGDGFGAANGGVLKVIPAEGDVTIRSCTFRNCRYGPNIIGFQGGEITVRNVQTLGCRQTCIGVYDVSGATVTIRGNHLNCDAFLLPPELTGGALDVPSSLGCIVAVQGIGAAVGLPFNRRFFELAFDADAHAAHPEAGPLGSWRPQGQGAIPQPSSYTIRDNSCICTETPNTYCIHVVDATRFAFGSTTLELDVIRDNSCSQCQTCIGVEHVSGGEVILNDCNSQSFGVELHNASGVVVKRNDFEFSADEGCEIRILELFDKIDLSRVYPGAGDCLEQGETD